MLLSLKGKVPKIENVGAKNNLHFLQIKDAEYAIK